MNNKYWNKRKITKISFENIVDAPGILFRTASEIRTQIINTVENGARTGKVYKRGNKTHTASAPGEPPVTDSGQLVKSIGEPKKISDKEYQVIIRAQHAMYLENGTKDMRPRPFVKQSYEKAGEILKQEGIL